ncbi:Golgi to lysosome transport [Mactra antiquata]
MAAPMNGDGFDDDDDFEDFGGFEGADAMGQEPASPAQAVPNVWVAMAAPAVQGVSNVRPDLLCGQNRFPQHLDNPLTLDVAGSAQSSVQLNESSTSHRSHVDTGAELDFANFPDSDDTDVDNINLANDILDGSFRSSTNQSVSSVQSRRTETLPDISGLDLATGISNNNVDIGPIDTLQNEDTESSSNVLEMNFDQVTEPVNQNQVEVRNEVAAVNNEPANERVEPSELETLLQRANDEKEKIQKELEDQISENSVLSNDLERAQELSQSIQKRYNELQETHKKQLEELRQAGHETLTIVVDEYKSLLMTSLQQQQLANENVLCERLKLQSETFSEQLKKQQEEFKTSLVEHRESVEAKYSQSLEEITAKQKEEFDIVLNEERKKYKDYAQKEIEKQREELSNEIQTIIKSEQEKTKQVIESEQVLCREKLDQAIAEHRTEMMKALKDQKNKYQEELSVAVMEERLKAKESVQQSVQSVRDDMNKYLLEQRESDRTVQRRHLTSLDLFLQSARSQVTLLLDSRQSDGSKPGDNMTEHDKPET